MNERKNEIERIIAAYERRKEIVPSQLYSFFNMSNLFLIQKREQEILKIFKRYKITSLEGKEILDVGCGTGGELRNFIRYGAQPENLYGIDLLPDRIELAKRLTPNINFKCGDASNLPYEDESFDIVIQFVVFTSILDKDMKKSIASEMLRVNKPNGIIIWNDFHVNNPKNPDVRGIKKKEIYELFSNCDIYFKRVSLAPPLTRTIAPLSWLVCYFLEKMKIFNTHYLAVVRKGDR